MAYSSIALELRAKCHQAASTVDLCWNYANGHCKRGQSCRWRHSGDYQKVSVDSTQAGYHPLYVGIFLDRPEFTKLIELYKKALPKNRMLLPCCGDGHVTLHYGPPTPHISRLIERLSGSWVKLQFTGTVDLWHIQAAIVYVVHPELNRLNAGAEHHVTIATKEGQSPAAVGEFLNKKCGEPLSDEYPVKFDGRAVWGWVGVFYDGGKGRVPAEPSEPNYNVIRSLRSIALDSKPNRESSSTVLQPIIPRKTQNRSGHLPASPTVVSPFPDVAGPVLSPTSAPPNTRPHLPTPIWKRSLRKTKGRSQHIFNSKFNQHPYQRTGTHRMISPLKKLPLAQTEVTQTPMTSYQSNSYLKQEGNSQISHTSPSQSPSPSSIKQGDIPQPTEGLCVSSQKFSGTTVSETLQDGGTVPLNTGSQYSKPQTNPAQANLPKVDLPKKIVDLPRRSRPSRRKRTTKKASSLLSSSASSKVLKEINSPMFKDGCRLR